MGVLLPSDSGYSFREAVQLRIEAAASSINWGASAELGVVCSAVRELTNVSYAKLKRIHGLTADGFKEHKSLIYILYVHHYVTVFGLT